MVAGCALGTDVGLYHWMFRKSQHGSRSTKFPFEWGLSMPGSSNAWKWHLTPLKKNITCIAKIYYGTNCDHHRMGRLVSEYACLTLTGEQVCVHHSYIEVDWIIHGLGLRGRAHEGRSLLFALTPRRKCMYSSCLLSGFKCIFFFFLSFCSELNRLITYNDIKIDLPEG